MTMQYTVVICYVVAAEGGRTTRITIDKLAAAEGGRTTTNYYDHNHATIN